MSIRDRQKVSEAVAYGGNAVLLEKHGALTVGESLTGAFDRLEVLEMTAKLTLLSHIVKTENLTEEASYISSMFLKI